MAEIIIRISRVIGVNKNLRLRIVIIFFGEEGIGAVAVLALAALVQTRSPFHEAVYDRANS